MRKEQLLDIFKDVDETKKVILLPLINDIVFLEEELAKLRQKPFIMVNKANPNLQKATPAAKLYKELLQQYTNTIKIVVKTLANNTEGEEKSILGDFMANINAMMENMN